MKTLAVLFVVVVASPAAEPIGARGREADTCLTRVHQLLRQGEPIALLHVDSGTIRGRLMDVSFLEEVLMLARLDSAGILEMEIPISDITQIKYKRRGVYRPLYSILGFALGTIGGWLLENHVIDPGYGYSLFPSSYFSRGSFWGGLAGLVGGSFVSLILPSTRVLECLEPE